MKPEEFVLQVGNITRELRQAYHKANLVRSSQTEIIAEIEPGKAIVVLGRSVPHFHLKTTETYRLLKGHAMMIMGGVAEPVSGISRSVPPRCIHSCLSVTDEPAWIEVISDPPWDAEDHFEIQ